MAFTDRPLAPAWAANGGRSKHSLPFSRIFFADRSSARVEIRFTGRLSNTSIWSRGWANGQSICGRGPNSLRGCWGGKTAMSFSFDTKVLMSCRGHQHSTHRHVPLLASQDTAMPSTLARKLLSPILAVRGHQLIKQPRPVTILGLTRLTMLPLLEFPVAFPLLPWLRPQRHHPRLGSLPGRVRLVLKLRARDWVKRRRRLRQRLLPPGVVMMVRGTKKVRRLRDERPLMDGGGGITFLVLSCSVLGPVFLDFWKHHHHETEDGMDRRSITARHRVLFVSLPGFILFAHAMQSRRARQNLELTLGSLGSPIAIAIAIKSYRIVFDFYSNSTCMHASSQMTTLVLPVFSRYSKVPMPCNNTRIFMQRLEFSYICLIASTACALGRLCPN